jgi:hypothetical protein
MWFNLKFVPESFLKSATWIFTSEVVLNDVSVDDVWKYIIMDKDDTAIKYWHPEVSKIEWLRDDEQKQRERGEGGVVERIVTYKDWPFMILLAGPVRIHEHFDVWDDHHRDATTGATKMRRMGFYFKSLTRPSFLTYTGGREEFKVEQLDGGGGCKFTRIVALEPAFAVRWILGFITYPRLKYVFETKCPRRLLQAFKDNKFGIPSTSSS